MKTNFYHCRERVDKILTNFVLYTQQILKIITIIHRTDAGSVIFKSVSSDKLTE